MSEAPGLVNPGSSRAPNLEGVGEEIADKVQDTLGSEGEGSIDYPGPMAGRRRRFTNDEKRKFLEEANGPGESMSSVGRRYGLSVSLLFRWRRQLDGQARPNPRTTEDDIRGTVRRLSDIAATVAK